MGFITKQGLRQLDNYQYQPGGKTIIDTIMNYYWEACVKLIPMWIAPNLITFVGWCLVIASYGYMLLYDYTISKQLPSSVFFFSSFCIFAYSTLDAIDGKQARRTKSSSPLGQLFDHGCDSFSLTFFVLAVCQAAKLQKNQIFLIFITTQLAFWTSNWAEYHTGILRTKVGQFGVTEGEFSLLIIQLLTAIYGQKVWQVSAADILPLMITTPLKDYNPFLTYVLDQQLGTVVLYGFACSISFVTVYMIIRVLISKKKWGSLFEFLGIILLVIMQCCWNTFSIYEEYSGVILMNFGIVSSLLISKIIICSVTKMSFHYFHYELIPLLLTTVSIGVLERLLKVNRNAIIYIFWVSVIINVLVIFKFLYSTIRQITRYLGIQCFTLKKLPRKID